MQSCMVCGGQPRKNPGTPTHLNLENRALQKEVESLRTALDAKDETIRAKQELIETLRINHSK